MAFVLPTVASASTSAIEVASSPVVIVQHYASNTPQSLISKVAEEVGISSSTLYNLAMSESNLNPNAIGDKGCSVGIVQINLCVHTSISKEQALNPEWALRYAAREILADREDAWSVCNCYSYVWTKKKGLPKMAQIQPNSEAQVGSVAIFYYKDRETGKQVKHVALVTRVTSNSVTVDEANFTKCLTGTRVIPISDPRMVGFWDSNPL